MNGSRPGKKPQDDDGIALRRATAQECALLTELCIRSKAMWGYDRDFMARCRGELTVEPSAVESGLLQVAARGETVVGIVELSVNGGGHTDEGEAGATRRNDNAQPSQNATTSADGKIREGDSAPLRSAWKSGA